MDSEKSLLRNDLENQKTQEEIKKFVEDAEFLGHEDIAELGRKKLQEIQEKAISIEQTSQSQISQVNELGGSNEELKNRTGEVDKKIEEVTKNTQNEIKDVENQNIETNEKTTEDLEKELSDLIKSSFEKIDREYSELKSKVVNFNGNEKDYYDINHALVDLSYQLNFHGNNDVAKNIFAKLNEFGDSAWKFDEDRNKEVGKVLSPLTGKYKLLEKFKEDISDKNQLVSQNTKNLLTELDKKFQAKK